MSNAAFAIARRSLRPVSLPPGEDSPPGRPSADSQKPRLAIFTTTPRKSRQAEGHQACDPPRSILNQHFPPRKSCSAQTAAAPRSLLSARSATLKTGEAPDRASLLVRDGRGRRPPPNLRVRQQSSSPLTNRIRRRNSALDRRGRSIAGITHPSEAALSWFLAPLPPLLLLLNFWFSPFRPAQQTHAALIRRQTALGADRLAWANAPA